MDRILAGAAPGWGCAEKEEEDEEERLVRCRGPRRLSRGAVWGLNMHCEGSGCGAAHASFGVDSLTAAGFTSEGAYGGNGRVILQS